MFSVTRSVAPATMLIDHRNDLFRLSSERRSAVPSPEKICVRAVFSNDTLTISAELWERGC